MMLDLSDLTGDDAPVALEAFLEANSECPLDDSEVAAIRALEVGESTWLGSGCGVVQVRRVA